MDESEPGGRKDRQASRLKELADALVAAGYISLDEQADALGLSRSTTWTILKAKHKNYGLSAAIIHRILGKSDLNPRVRAKILEYVREKVAGSFGHNNTQLRRFVQQFAERSVTDLHDKFPLPLSSRPAKVTSGSLAPDPHAGDRHQVSSPKTSGTFS